MLHFHSNCNKLRSVTVIPVLHECFEVLWIEWHLTQMAPFSCHTTFFKSIWLKCRLSQRSTTKDLWESQRPLKWKPSHSHTQFLLAIFTKIIIYDYFLKSTPFIIFVLFLFHSTRSVNNGDARKEQKAAYIVHVSHSHVGCNQVYPSHVFFFWPVIKIVCQVMRTKVVSSGGTKTWWVNAETFNCIWELFCRLVELLPVRMAF